MRLELIKTKKSYETREDISNSILRWGIRNDYPDKLEEVVEISGTAFSCLGVYIDFLTGKGIKDSNVKDFVVNEDGDTLQNTFNRSKADFAKYNACCLHVNINASFDLVSIKHIPFKYFRLGIRNKKDGLIRDCSIYDDWGRRSIKNFNSVSDLKPEKYPLFSFNRDELRRRLQEDGDFINSKGFIVYFNPDGDQCYPKPIYMPLVGNMRSEEALSNVLSRNVCNNFLTAGAIVDILNKDETKTEKNQTKESLLGFQGDFESCKIMYLQVRSKEEIPEFINFQTNNYDKQFTFTAEYLPATIGKIFKQPPVLRMEDVAEGLSANKMREGYTMYNTITQKQRDFLDSSYTSLFRMFVGFPSEAVIDTKELSFVMGSSVIEKYGVDTANKIFELVENTDIERDKKINYMVYIYGIDQEDAEALL